MGFQRKVFEFPLPTGNKIIPILEPRPGRVSIDATLWYDNGSWFFVAANWHYYRVKQGPWVTQEWFLGVTQQTAGDYWFTMVNDTQIYYNGSDYLYPGVASDTGYTGEFGNVPGGFSLPMLFVVCESWEDQPWLSVPKCDDGKPAKIFIDQVNNKIDERCHKRKAFPIISIDATVQRMRKRGLLNV